MVSAHGLVIRHLGLGRWKIARPGARLRVDAYVNEDRWCKMEFVNVTNERVSSVAWVASLVEAIARARNEL